MAFAPMVFMAISTAMSVASAISSAQQQKDAAEYNRKVAENQATSARQVAGARAEQQTRAAQRQMGKMEAAYSASGVSMEGSALDMLQQSASEAELDRLTLIHTGELQAAGHDATAELERVRGKNAMQQGYMKAGSALFGGMSKMAGGMGGGMDAGASYSGPSAYDTEYYGSQASLVRT